MEMVCQIAILKEKFTLQFLVTLITRCHKPMSVLIVGMQFYAVSVALIVLVATFWVAW